MRGGEEKHIVVIPYDGGGHAWVCDGYKRSENCEYDANGNFTGTVYMYTCLHMNWGWGKRWEELNTWYAYNDWRVLDGNYNYNKKMIYNVKP